jgi:hypothetical protein
MRGAFTCMILAALGGCASGGPTLGPLSDIRFEELAPSGPDTAACEGFRFGVEEARRFFARAVVVTPYDVNYDYVFAGCTARGTASVRGQPVTWEVDRGGTGTVSFSREFSFAVADPRRRTRAD